MDYTEILKALQGTISMISDEQPRRIAFDRLEFVKLGGDASSLLVWRILREGMQHLESLAPKTGGKS